MACPGNRSGNRRLFADQDPRDLYILGLSGQRTDADNPRRAGLEAGVTLAGGCSYRTVAQELYTGSNLNDIAWEAECCDAVRGCRSFRASSRDTFWPDFAHPRWLSCDALYSRHAQRLEALQEDSSRRRPRGRPPRRGCRDREGFSGGFSE